MRRDDQRQAVKNIPLEQLKPFKNHPFQVRDDEEFRRLVESIEIHGVIHPAVARQIGEDCYELISGHRRKAACEVLGYSEMPVLVRSMTDDEAVVNMVDANLQRETILPSERAFAYKMKLVAMSHQGRKGFTSTQLGRKCVGKESRELIAEQVGQSRNQISRYIRLTELIPEILEMVDNRKIALTPAVSISYLDKKQQKLLYKVMVALKATPSISWAKAIREKASESDFTEDYLVCILSEKEPNQREPMIVEEKIKQYFPSHYNVMPLLSFRFRCGLKFVEQKVHLPDPLIDVPVSAIPGVAVQPVVDGIQPPFGGVIHTALVNARQECFRRLVFEGTGMAEYHRDLPVSIGQPLFHLVFGCFVGLFVRPPVEVSHKTIVLIHTVGSADHQMLSSAQCVNLTIHGKKDMGILRLDIHLSSVPIVQHITGDMGRPTLMVAMDAQDCGATGIELFLYIVIPLVQVVIGPHIAQNHQRVACLQPQLPAKLHDHCYITMGITRVEHHTARSFSLFCFYYSRLLIPYCGQSNVWLNPGRNSAFLVRDFRCSGSLFDAP